MQTVILRLTSANASTSVCSVCSRPPIEQPTSSRMDARGFDVSFALPLDVPDLDADNNDDVDDDDDDDGDDALGCWSCVGAVSCREELRSIS
eukprot:768798-Rhodomonas_salina.1